MSDAMQIALTGLNDATKRVQVAAQNIANASTTGEVPSEANNQSSSVYVAKDVVSSSMASGYNNLGVATNVVDRQPAYTLQADPSSSQANSDGVVAAPNVDLASEIVTAQVAADAYRANVAIIKVVNDTQKSLMGAIKA